MSYHLPWRCRPISWLQQELLTHRQAHPEVFAYGEHLYCTMQSPKDRSITKGLADAEELLLQSSGKYNPTNLFLAKPGGKSYSSLADFTGCVKVTSLPGTALHLRCIYDCMYMVFNSMQHTYDMVTQNGLSKTAAATGTKGKHEHFCCLMLTDLQPG